jgi:hypothetical protein
VSRLSQLAAAIEHAQRLERDVPVPSVAAPGNTPWMPFNLFDFAALLFEAIPLIPDAGTFLDVGAGPGSKMLIARDVFGLDVHGIEVLPALAEVAAAEWLQVEVADAGTWRGYEKYSCVWLNRPVRDPVAELLLEARIRAEMAPGAVLLCANLEHRPPQDWIIVNDSWDDLRRGAWIKPYPVPEI